MDANGDPELSKRAFTGLKSLGQGMAQEIWTVFCASVILAKFYKMGMDVHITAAGDNQFILIRETKKLSGRRFQRVIEKVIEDSAAKMGHKNKPEETFSSRHFQLHA